MMAAIRIFLIIAGLALILGEAISSDEYEISAPSIPTDNYIDNSQSNSLLNEQSLDISSYTTASPYAIKVGFRPQSQEQYHITITPAIGAAPLSATLQVSGMDQRIFSFWDLDWDGDGQSDTMGQGEPFWEVIYPFSGNYFPVFNFYNGRNQMIAQARGSITVTDQHSSVTQPAAIGDNIMDPGKVVAIQMPDIDLSQAQAQLPEDGGFQIPKLNDTGDTGSQSQALSASPGGWGIVRDTQRSGGRRPTEDLSDEPSGWSPPKEEFTEYLKLQLYASVEKGSAPLTVDFDASGTYSRYGVMKFNYDVIWGPHEAEDDGYYLYSGYSPQWTHTFDEYGMYLVILDVEDYSGKRARVTKVIFVL